MIAHTKFKNFIHLDESFKEKYDNVDINIRGTSISGRFKTDRGDFIFAGLTKLRMDTSAMEDVLDYFGIPTDKPEFINNNMNVYNVAFRSSESFFEPMENSSIREAMKILGTIIDLMKDMAQRKNIHMYIFEGYEERQERLYKSMLNHLSNNESWKWYFDNDLNEFYIRTDNPL